MPVSDPYGLAASGLPPDMLTELAGISRRQQVMNAILQQSAQPIDIAPPHGRFASRASPLSGVAKIVQAYMGSQGLQDTDKAYADLAGRAAQARTQALSQYQQARDGSPAQSIAQPVAGDDEGNAMPPAVKDAVPGDRRAAIAQALINPLLAGNPLVQADLKKVEPDWTPTKQFNPTTGREERVLVNKNDPSQVRTMGGQKAPELKEVTTVDPVTKQPVTTFVNPQEVKTPIAQPVKMEMKDTGRAIEPVNPYAPTTLTKTVTPSDVYHRGTQFAVAGLGEDGLPTGDIKEIASGIANLQLPPLGNFALARPRGQAIMAEVLNQKPDYSAQDYTTSQKALNDFATGKNGNQVRFLSTAVDHIQTAKQAAAALQNGDIPLFNKASQALAQATGQPAPTTFDGIKQILGNEIVKGIVGAGGGVADRDKAQETISRASSPQQFLGVMNGYENLMRGQLNGLRRQYEVTTKRKDFDKFISEQAKTEIGGASPSVAPAPNKALFDQADAILGGK